MASALPQAEPVRHVLLSPADTAQQTRRGGMRPGPGRPVMCERPRACSCPSWKQRGQSAAAPTAARAALSGPFLAPRAPEVKGLVRRPGPPSSAGPCAQELSAVFSSHTLISPRGSVGKESPRSQTGRLGPRESQSAQSAGGSLLLQVQIPTGRLWCGEAGPRPFFFLDTSLGHGNSQERRGSPSKRSGLELWPCCLLSQPNH